MSASRLFRNGSPSLYMRSTLIGLSNSPRSSTIFWNTSILHHALEAPGLRDHVAVAGRAERAFEIARARRIGEDDERRRQRDDRFQRRASFQIDSRLQTGFHARSPATETTANFG